MVAFSFLRTALCFLAATAALVRGCGGGGALMFRSRSWRVVTPFVVFAIAVVGCSADSNSNDFQTTGSLSVTLQIDGAEIDTVAWEITGGEMEPMSDTIDTSAPGSTASIEVFGLPPTAGPDYTITMEAISVDQEVTCEGSADFGIDVGEVTGVMVFLNCKRPERLGGVRVNGKFNICAELSKVVVSPLETSVGSDIDVSALATDPEGDAITYMWSATPSDGGFDDPTARETTYRCGTVGEKVLTITVTDDLMYCDDSWPVLVNCVPRDGDPCENVTCDPTGNECSVAECNPANGQCETSNVDDGTLCDNETGMCLNGQCIVDKCKNVTCDPTGSDCTVAECNPANGQCETSNVDDGTLCDNEDGMCLDGQCVVDRCENVTCDPTGNECTEALCNMQTGECDIITAPNGTQCDEGGGTCFDGRCIGCAGDSVGDPHLITFDRRHYDLQTVGEYILARSPALTDGFEIQARTSPWGNRRDVSVNIAIAANVGGDVVSVYAGEADIFINREPVSVSGRFDLPGGGYVQNLGAVIELVWPTGDLARITRRLDFLDLHVEAASARCGALVGLLGDGDGNPDNDLVPQDATDPLSEPVSFDDLLNVFGDSWRIMQEESLFEYPEGLGTEDFTDLTFPDRLTTAADLPPDVRAAAESLCRELGLTDAVLLEACILDYGATGEESFLDVYPDVEPPVRTTDPWAPARVRVAHLAPEIPTAENTAVDIFIDGERSSIQGLTFGNSTGFIELPPREYLFGIAPAGGEPIVSFPATLSRGQSTTVVAIRTVSNRGTLDPVDVLIFNDPPQSSPEGFGRFAGGHGADDTSIVTLDGINTRDCPPPVFEDLAFGSVQGPGNFLVGVHSGALATPDSCVPFAGPWAAPTYPDTPSLAVAVDLDTNDSSPDVVGYILIGDAEGRIPTMPFLVEEPGPDGCDVGLCLFDDKLRALCEASLAACLDDAGDPAREKECLLGAPVICKGDSGTDEPELLEAPRFAPGPGLTGQALAAPGDPIDAQIAVNAATRLVRVELANAWVPGIIDTEEIVTLGGSPTLDLVLQGGPEDVGRYFMRVTLCGLDCGAFRVVYDILECEDPPSDVCGINGVYQRTSIQNGEVVGVEQTPFDFGSQPGLGSGTVVIQ